MGQPGSAGQLAASAEILGRPDLVASARWLAEHPPAPMPDVVCHGDLHPFNLLVDDDSAVTVLDWSAGLLAPAAYDVAFTSLVLAEPPLTVPRPAGPLVRYAGRLLSRRFLRHYEQLTGAGLDVAPVRWHQGVVCLRSLGEVAGWVAAGQVEDRRGHPWLVCGPAFAARLSALTGAVVRPR